jgi:hypothetical protein
MSENNFKETNIKPDKMVPRPSQIHTRISTQTKIRWENFLISLHGSVKGSYGNELEKAMNFYMNEFNSISIGDVEKKPNKQTIESWKNICNGFRNLPTFPLVTPMVLQSVVRDCCMGDDPRTILKYLAKVKKFTKSELVSGETFPKENVNGFCEYVDRCIHEHFTK